MLGPALRCACCATLALALALVPIRGVAQARDELVWHWFGDCAGTDSLVLDVQLDGQPVYSTTFPVCQRRRRDIKPGPQERLVQFRFTAEAHRFGSQYPAAAAVPIQGTIWEVRDEPGSILLGVSYATEERVLLNTRHPALPRAESRTERVRHLIMTTWPLHPSKGR